MQETGGSPFLNTRNEWGISDYQSPWWGRLLLDSLGKPILRQEHHVHFVQFFIIFLRIYALTYLLLLRFLSPERNTQSSSMQAISVHFCNSQLSFDFITLIIIPRSRISWSVLHILIYFSILIMSSILACRVHFSYTTGKYYATKFPERKIPCDKNRPPHSISFFFSWITRMWLELIHVLGSEEFAAEFNYERYYYIQLVSLYVHWL